MTTQCLTVPTYTKYFIESSLIILPRTTAFSGLGCTLHKNSTSKETLMYWSFYSLRFFFLIFYYKFKFSFKNEQATYLLI